MAHIVFIYGKSGAGKSRSLKNFMEDEIFLIKCMDKELPFRSPFKYTLMSTDTNLIYEKLAKMNKIGIKSAVIDDAGYIMTNLFMSKHGKGDQYALFNLIGDTMWNLINKIKKLPDDVIIYLVFHEEKNDDGDTKLLTVGKLLDQKVCLEGMVTVVLHCIVEGNKHYFITSEDSSIAKAPEEMFKEQKFDNDLKYVDTAVREYYGIAGGKKEEKKTA